jgi:hypothetical protein
MNIKFRMPKLWGKAKHQGTFKEILLTTIATSISIVLTFGTAHLIEQREANQARRLLAMTIVSDIDESLKVVKGLLDKEDRDRSYSNYLMGNMHRLDSVPDDTLLVFFNYVTSYSFNSDLEFKKTNEAIFNSSQDSWRKLNDRKFLNNVQEFYNTRAVVEQQCKEWIYFQKPLTKQEEFTIMIDSEDMDTREAFVATCRRLLGMRRVKKYIDNAGRRMTFYREFLKLVNLNEENKFLMGITEQDMEDFLNHSYMTVRPVKDKELVGSWEAVMADDKHHVAYEFRKDHTFTTRQSISYTHTEFMGNLIQRFTLSGTWAVEGDSLVKHYDLSSYKLEIDVTGAVYQPNMEETISKLKEELASEMMKPKLVKRLQDNNRISHATNLDQTGTRLEMKETDGSPVHYQRKTVESK